MRWGAAVRGFFERVSEETKLVVYLKDADGRYLYVNPAFEAVSTIPRGRILGRTDDELFPPAIAGEFRSQDAETVRRRAMVEFEETLTLPTGVRSFITQKLPLIDEKGRVYAVGGFCAEVTAHVERNERERARTREREEALRLLNQQKLESLGTMAGGIAHDFNNLLVGIEGNLSVLAAGLEGDEKSAELLRDMETACRKTKDLARQLLTFASGGGPVLRSEDLVPIVRETAALLTRGTNVRCAFAGKSGPLWARVDKSQISQVVQNLVLNARQAMPEGGTIQVALSSAEVSAGEVPDLDPGSYVRVTIKDEGPGIPEESRLRIFDPYYTTKSEGRGLGLAVCRSIVVKHGGHIGVESGPEGGTVFTIHLPAAKARLQAREKAPAARSELKGARILVMDDEPDVGKALKRLLECLGGEASVTLDGREALEAYRAAKKSGKPFAAVIADLTVPGGMGGKEMLKRLKRVDPKARVIVSSGYSSDPILADHEAHGFRGVLSKPYRLDDVSAALAKVLKKS